MARHLALDALDALVRAAVASCALVGAGCGATPKPAPPPAVNPPPPAPPPAPACIKPPEETAPITHASGDETHVQYCVGTVEGQCFALELATGKLVRLDAAPAAPAPASAAPRVETTNPELKICNADQCKTLTPQVWPGAAPLRVATNGSFAVVLLGDPASGKGYADVWDVAKTKRVTTIRYTHGDFRCGDVAMLGDTIYLGANACTSPSGRAALYTTTGRKIANVGRGEFGTYGNAHVQVDGATWAFLEENGNRIALQDVVKGKVLKTIEVVDLWRAPAAPGTPPAKSDALGNPGESALVRLAADKLAVIAGTPANGSVGIVDINSGEVKVVRAPLCH